MKDSLRNRQGVRMSAQGGFTLLETAIAFTIMLAVGLGATGLFLYANNYNSGATDRALAISVAKQQMEQLRSVSFTDTLLTIPSGSTSTTSSSTVSNGGRSYTVTKTIEYMSTCTGCNAAKKITITVTPQSSKTTWGGTAVSVVSIRANATSGPYFQ